MTETTTSVSLAESARRTFQLEARAIEELAGNLTSDFEHAVQAILKAKGKTIVCGMGKSGHIGKKIAATLASTGTPSFFLHPAEAFHGDLGMIGEEDILILISYSGETEEILRLIPHLKEREIPIVAMTGNNTSTLAKNANYTLNVKVSAEACPLSLAPTASTTATLVMGDAIAIALMEQRGFKPDDFARFHPGGTLGKRLLGKVKEYTRYDNLPFVRFDANVREVIYKLAEGRLGLVLISKNDGKVGIITDGDFRRSLTKIKYLDDWVLLDYVNFNPIKVDENTPIYKAEEVLLKNRITTLLVTKESKVVGVFQMFNLF